MSYIGINNQEDFGRKVAEIQSKFSGYEYPKTKEEYWNIVDKYWSDLLEIILRFGPEYTDFKDHSFARLAVIATRLKENRSSDLALIFEKTWASAPDSGQIHAIPAWHILCDLCSESYLLLEEYENDSKTI